MNFLIDTNVCIGILNNSPSNLQRKLVAAVRHGGGVYVSSISIFELWYGIYFSARLEKNRLRVEKLMEHQIQRLSFEDEDAEIAGRVRAELRRRGTPVGPYDVLIAGQALRHGHTLVTANTSEFERIDGLSCEDWTR